MTSGGASILGSLLGSDFSVSEGFSGSALLSALLSGFSLFVDGMGLVVELGSSGLTFSLLLEGACSVALCSSFFCSALAVVVSLVDDVSSDLYSLSSSFGVTMESRSGWSTWLDSCSLLEVVVGTLMSVLEGSSDFSATEVTAVGAVETGVEDVSVTAVDVSVQDAAVEDGKDDCGGCCCCGGGGGCC